MKAIEIPFGAKDSELKGWEYTIPEGMEAEIKDGKIVVREKKSEDERIRKFLITIVNNLCAPNFKDVEKKDVLAYLEKQKEHQFYSDAPKEKSVGGNFYSSHKDKNLDDIAQDYVEAVKEYNPEPTWNLMQTAVCYGYHLAEQKPVEWGEEEEAMRNNIIRVLSAFVGTVECESNPSLSSSYPTYLREIDWLKSLRPQPKQEWSEKDEKMRERLITRLNWITYNTRTDGTSPNITFFDEIDWLKSLRPSWKPSEVCYGAKGDPDPAGVWKPSEEQMNCLCAAVDAAIRKHNESVSGYEPARVLKSLYEQLRKLM